MRGLTSTLFKVGEYGELAQGREAQKTYAGRCVSLRHMVGLGEAGMTVLTFPERMGVGGRKEGEKGVSFQKFAKHLLVFFSTGNGQFPKA